ncbi:hypothetical protein ACFY8P_26990 [Streptomyces sp. NPDC012693]|uniref:hypothetical protein n=1 Tax=Streptomyces sp. NPDC012693 TaxID=3364844 RepID=UPI0036B14409
MTATVITAETLIHRYADDIAYVAKQAPATDLAALISQLDTAAPRYEAACINATKTWRSPRPSSTRPCAPPAPTATSSCTRSCRT